MNPAALTRPLSVIRSDRRGDRNGCARRRRNRFRLFRPRQALSFGYSGEPAEPHQPLLDKHLVAFQSRMRWLSAAEAKLGQETPHRDKAPSDGDKTQCDLEFVLDLLSNRRMAAIARPQREGELHLQRILLRRGGEDPRNCPARKFRLTQKQSFAFNAPKPPRR